jgi:hypothetical protein
MTTPTTRVPNAIPSLGVGALWGLGPSLSEWGGHAVWTHSGGVRSARSLLCWSPETDSALAITVNTPAGFETFVATLVERIGKALFGGVPLRRVLPASEHIQPSGLERFVGTYLRFGTRYDLSVEHGRLRFLETNLGVGSPGEVIGVVVHCDCVSVADDSFLIVVPGFDEPLPISFSGESRGGHAMTLVSLLFPARRAGAGLAGACSAPM